MCVFPHICALCTLVHIPVVASALVFSETIFPTATSTSLTPGPSASAETAAGQRICWYIWLTLYLANAPILASGELYILGKLPFN